MIISVYDKKSCAFRGIQSVGAEDLVCYDDENIGFVEGSYRSSDFYVKDDLPVIRPANPTTISATTIPADGETLAVLQAVAGILTIIGPSERDEYEVPGGPVELAFDTPGEYTLRLEAFPLLPFAAVIHAY